MCFNESLRLTYNAYEGDDGSEGDLSLAQLPVTHGHAVRDLAEADGGRDLHEGVPAQQPQHQRQHEGEHAAVGVGLLAEQHQGQLPEHNHEHEVPTKYAENK